MRRRFAMACVWTAALACACRSTREERDSLLEERDRVSDQLNAISPRSRWAQHQDTERVMDYRDQIDQRINELNEARE